VSRIAVGIVLGILISLAVDAMFDGRQRSSPNTPFHSPCTKDDSVTLSGYGISDGQWKCVHSWELVK
jgi:hypothetical protein